MDEKNQNRLKWIFTIFILIGSLGYTGWILFRGSSDTVFTVNQETNSLSIEGMYEQTIVIDSETQIALVDPIEITRRTNGSALGDKLKGYFTLTGDVAVYLNLGDQNLQWIQIINDDDIYYINYDNETDTLSLYNELIAIS